MTRMQLQKHELKMNTLKQLKALSHLYGDNGAILAIISAVEGLK